MANLFVRYRRRRTGKNQTIKSGRAIANDVKKFAFYAIKFAFYAIIAELLFGRAQDSTWLSLRSCYGTTSKPSFFSGLFQPFTSKKFVKKYLALLRASKKNYIKDSSNSSTCAGLRLAGCVSAFSVSALKTCVSVNR